MGILGEMDQNHRRDTQLYNSIFNLLCYEKIGFTGTNKKSWTGSGELSLPLSNLYSTVCSFRGAVQAVPHR